MLRQYIVWLAEFVFERIAFGDGELNEEEQTLIQRYEMLNDFDKCTITVEKDGKVESFVVTRDDVRKA